MMQVRIIFFDEQLGIIALFLATNVFCHFASLLPSLEIGVCMVVKNDLVWIFQSFLPYL